MPTLTSAATTPVTGLTSDELAHFHERGWVRRRGLFDHDTIARMAAEVDGLHERMAACTPPGINVAWEEDLPADRPPRIRQLMHSERVCPAIEAASKSAAMLTIMRQLIGPDVWLFHSKLMMKAARDGSFTPWHQDWGYWQRESHQPTQVNCMLYLDASDAANGALRLVDGSHRPGAVDHTTFASKSFNIGLPGGLDAFPATLVDCLPGDAIFFGPMVIHGSGPNTSDRDRRANTFAFDRPGNQRREPLPAANWRCGRRD